MGLMSKSISFSHVFSDEKFMKCLCVILWPGICAMMGFVMVSELIIPDSSDH